MDNKKIGKLIADLRKKQGLTQQELGDKVGVGFRAVSKWERGLTLPDISIINELSKILGISSDELLTGEISKENKSKEKRRLSKKIKVTITIMSSIIIVLTSVLIYYNNKTYVYNIYSANLEDYVVEGQVSFSKDKISIIINSVRFENKKLNSIKIKNYEYDISSNGEFIFRFGYSPTTNNLEETIAISEFMKNFNINTNSKIVLKRKDIIENSIKLTLRFIDANNMEVTKDLELRFEKI